MKGRFFINLNEKSILNLTNFVPK